MSYRIVNIREIIYCTSNLKRAKKLFVDYGGWKVVGEYNSDPLFLETWVSDSFVQGRELLIQSEQKENGRLRILELDNADQICARSSQNPWDIGGIMDINLRSHDVPQSFEELRELGFHGLSDPMLQQIGPFKLYDVLMRGPDDIIIAITHRLEPPMSLASEAKFPTHIYKTSITVRDFEEAKRFYVQKLGCTLLSEYEFIKDKPQENMFGLPYNLADKVLCKAAILSIHGGKDIDFQIVSFDGVRGKDFSWQTRLPNKGFVSYRVELEGVSDYINHLQKEGLELFGPVNFYNLEPFGSIRAFNVMSPNGVVWEFFEPTNN